MAHRHKRELTGIRRVHYSPVTGEVVTRADLPRSWRVKWCRSLRAIVVVAVYAGYITLDEAGRRYLLSVEEFMAWRDALLNKYGRIA